MLQASDIDHRLRRFHRINAEDPQRVVFVNLEPEANRWIVRVDVPDLLTAFETYRVTPIERVWRHECRRVLAQHGPLPPR
jgi:hypothetical protein